MREQAFLDLKDDLDHNVAKVIAAGSGPMALAQRIADNAKMFAPVDTGAYRDSIVAERTQNGARVVAQDEKAHWIEFGRPLHNVSGQYVLRQGAIAIGLEFVKRRK